MAPNNHANSAKRCKKKVQTVADFRNKISFLNLQEMNNQKSLNKDSKIIGDKGADLTSHKTSASCLRQYDNETEVCSTVNECKFDREINRSSFNCKTSRPSLFGSTMRIGNSDLKSTRRICRRKMNHYKALIKILMNVRAKDLSNTIMKETLRFSRENDDVEFSGDVPAIEFSNDKPDADSQSDKKNGILSSKRREADVQTPRPKNAGRKSIELSKTSGKIFDKYFTASTSKNICKGFENFDDEPTDCEMSFGKKRNSDSDSDTTIPKSIELFNKHPNLLDKIGDKKVGEYTANETWLQECINPFEFDDSDVAFGSHRENVKDTKILETTKKTGRISSSMKKDQKNQCIELEEYPSSVKKNVKVSPVNDGGKKPISENIEQRNSRKNEVVYTADYIPDLAKGGKTCKDSLKPGGKSRKDEEAEKVSKKSEARNSNQPEFIVKSKATGNYCSCKRTKLKDVKTSAYSVPANIEYPSLNIRKECGKRSVAIKSFENLIFEKEKESLIGEKKTKTFYSPLELEYSDVMKSKLDADHVSNNQSRPINDDSSKAHRSLLKEKKSAGRVSDPLKKCSISNITVSNNSPKNDDTNTECGPNNLKSLKIPKFSEYSIPVSIEINMAKDDSRKRVSSMNLIQSKLTRYFPLLKLQNKKVSDKSLNLNSTGDFEETGSIISERKKTVARSKSKSRSLPVIESDVLLKDTEKVIYFKNIPLRKPQLSISRRNYLYGVLNDSETAASNQNIIHRENIKPVINGKEKSRNNHDLIYIDDSNSSIESIVPPSYSIFSDDDNKQSTIIDIDKILDTQQREDLLAPWENANLVYL